MRLLLVGPPGSGKGTQAKLLCDRLHLRHLATGDLLREAIQQQTPAGREAQPFVANGALVPDELVNQMVAERFRGADQPQRFVMDGYPRTKSQAVVFDDLLTSLSLSLQAVLELVIADEDLIRRLGNRRVCSNPECQAPYHLLSQPPKVSGECDRCHAPLVQRSDDNEATIRQRLRVYHETSRKLLDHYRGQEKLHQIKADQEIEAIYSAIQEELRKI